MRRIGSHLTYANVISTLCLFLLLGGGTAMALSGHDTVQSDDLGPGAQVKAPDVAGNAVDSANIQNGQVKRGDQVRDQETDWAVVNADHTIAAQSGGISLVDVGGPQGGKYHLRFPVPLGTRPITATIDGEAGAIGQVSATRCGTTPPGGASCSLGLDQHHVFVETANGQGTITDEKFIVVVLPR
jgi:hypothetical protein